MGGCQSEINAVGAKWLLCETGVKVCRMCVGMCGEVWDEGQESPKKHLWDPQTPLNAIAQNRTQDQKGLRDRNSPTCTLSQNGYGELFC